MLVQEIKDHAWSLLVHHDMAEACMYSFVKLLHRRTVLH